MQHAPPFLQWLVGGEDHRAPSQVPIVDDVIEHVRSVRSVRQISYFVHDQDVWVCVALQGVVETTMPTRVREILDQLGGRREARLEAELNRAIPDGHGEMRLTAPGLTQKDQRPSLGDELCVHVGSEYRGA